MAPTVGDYLLERLRAWDVQHVFGYPGDGINGILAAWGRADNKPQFVQARHEEMAAFEAVGYAKFTGRLGVCAATSGPGAIHLLNGLYDAKLDHVPVVAIVGQTSRSAMGGSYQQEVDLMSLYKDVASDYVQMVTVSEQLPNVLDRAIKVALTERTVTALIIPSDVQELPYSAPSHAFKMVPSSLGVDWAGTSADDQGIAQAAEILNAGRKVAILAGQGARGARAELEQVAELLGAGVAKALLGKDVLSDELPYVTGSIGLLGTRPSYEMMMNCDTLLTVGSSFPYTQFMPAFDQARAVQIDIDGKFIGMRYPYELTLIGDSAATLRDLIPHLRRKEDRSGREGIEEGVAKWWRSMDAEADVAADPVNPMLVFRELSSRLPADAIVTADSGSSANWYARQLKFRGGMRGSLSGNLATMGPG
ncbi:MAG: thiamine pyrophosphate-binding protein, partial [Trebonia sp.]